MTAKEVNGIPVVSDEPRRAPFSDNGGRPVYQWQTRVLILADGTTAYGCRTCDYTSDNPNSIRPHLSKHKNRKTTGATREPLDLPLSELMERLKKLDQITEERDAWKTRAQTAERRLAQLRNALGVSA